MGKLGTWAIALFLAAVTGLLSTSAFLGWEHSGSSNKVIGMLIALEQFLVGAIGGMLTGLLFAALTLVILVAAWKHDPAAEGNTQN